MGDRDRGRRSREEPGLEERKTARLERVVELRLQGVSARWRSVEPRGHCNGSSSDSLSGLSVFGRRALLLLLGRTATAAALVSGRCRRRRRLRRRRPRSARLRLRLPACASVGATAAESVTVVAFLMPLRRGARALARRVGRSCRPSCRPFRGCPPPGHPMCPNPFFTTRSCTDQSALALA